MTVDNTDEPDLRKPEQNQEKSIKSGFADPLGQFPRLRYAYQPTTNKAARATQENQLDLGGEVSISEKLPSRYPYNQVSETVSGHVIEIDDTPGAERILIKHRSGSGIELSADGSVSVKSEKNSISVTEGNSTVIVEGDVSLKFKGNVNLDISGDLNLSVGGNITTKIGGDSKKTILGSSENTVYKDVNLITQGAQSNTIVGKKTETVLDTLTNIVKGDFENIIQGKYVLGSSDQAKITSSKQVIVSSEDINIGANNLSVFGASGTIGGSNIVHYGITYYGTTFHGDLIGIAEKAQDANIAYVPTNNNTSTAKPTSSLLDEYLTKSSYGIFNINIDEGNHIKNSIDLTEYHGGISDKPLTSQKIRSKLRDQANRENQTFIGNLLSDGKLSSTYIKSIPSEINRVSGQTPATKIGQEQINPVLISNTRFKPSKNYNSRIFVPDPRYDVNKYETIDHRTKLADNITLAKFLPDVTINHLDQNQRKNIARQFSMQVPLVLSVMRNKGQFKNHRLVIVDGLYVKGPKEILTSNSINDLATFGRVVSYQLYNSDGINDLEKLYDLAVYWKDQILFDRLILEYDTIEDTLNCQLTVVMPEIDDQYNIVGGKYSNKILTTFNNYKQGNDLIEIVDV